MHLTLHADYALRVLLYLASSSGRRVPTAEISEAFGISMSHLVKVVNGLAQLGYITTYRGRQGGSELAVDAADINLGEVIQQVEPNLDLVQCFNARRSNCPIRPTCGVKTALRRAQRAFMAELRTVSLADVSPAKSTTKLFKNGETANAPAGA